MAVQTRSHYEYKEFVRDKIDRTNVYFVCLNKWFDTATVIFFREGLALTVLNWVNGLTN